MDKKQVRYLMKRAVYIFLFIFSFAGIGTNVVHSQNVTYASGIVRDSVTGEPLPYVSVVFENSTIGVITNDEGIFEIQNDRGLDTLAIYFLGYDTKFVPLQRGKRNKDIELHLSPSTFQLSEVIVKPHRERYSRRNNPAVDLVREVIERKDSNRIVIKDEYQTECYEKLSMSLDKFDANYENNKLLKNFKFIKNYLDTSEFNGKPILTISIREKISDVYYRKSPQEKKVLIKARRQRGLDQTLDEYGTITANLEEILKEVDVFDNNITFLLNRFVSPLSSALATTYYQYYIMDTLDIGGDRCVDLAFVPVNSQSYGFTGRLYITLDGTYAVKKILLNIPTHINLNYVKNLRIEQEFKRMDDGLWALDKDNTYIVFYFIDGGQQLYAHQLRSFDKYSDQIAQRDSIFKLQGEERLASRDIAPADSFWINHRHIPLKEKEHAIENLVEQLKEVPAFNVLIKTLEILVSGYIPINDDHHKNKLDFGPMNTTFSSNEVEGFRMRVGATTTAHLNPHVFLGGFAAYGMSDRKWKYNTKLTYTFQPKDYHEKESPINNLSLMHEYDLYTPGQEFLFTSKDNMFVAMKVGKSVTKMNYLRTTKLQYEKEWLNGLSVKTWMQQQNSEATGTLRYILYDSGDRYTRLNSINTTEVSMQLRFAPHERAYNSRLGKESLFNLSKDAPVFMLTHQVGLNNVLSGEYKYNRTEASVKKRIWLSSFGHIDASVKAGKVWDKVPFPLLIMPNTNQSITIQPESFHLMNAMEFVADQYVSVDAAYYLKGWILNRIPVINLLRMREVVSFTGVYGRLSDKNNPVVSNHLFLFPEGTGALENKPYMEFSFGLENIFRILQVNYYRRLSYLNNPDIQKNGFRIALRFSF